MIAGVADTHAALWYLFGDPRLSPSAKSTFEIAANSRRKIVLSVISLAEVVYLVEKNRLPPSAYADLQTALRDPDHVLQEAPVTAEVIDAMLEVPRVDIPDMPDALSPRRPSILACPPSVATAAFVVRACKLSGEDGAFDSASTRRCVRKGSAEGASRERNGPHEPSCLT
jgi:PIN domain nuclease of toxin-antitoxin system